MKIKLIMAGKLKEREFREYEADLKKRISAFAVLTDIAVESEPDILRNISRGDKAYFLDPTGEQPTSREFSGLLGVPAVSFVIGPASGFTPAMRQSAAGAGKFLSLSKLTFPHRLCKIILLEQIYRGFCIDRGFPYAK